jgi:hypothetical protein
VPALPFVPGVAKIVVKQTQDGVPVYNIFHADGGAGTGWTTTELNALATAVKNSWQSNFLVYQHAGLQLVDVTAIDLASDTGPQATVTSGVFGTLTGTKLSANAAACISWKIARRYRGGHPRTYVGGGVPGQLSTANTWTTTVTSSWKTSALALRTAINAVTTSAGSAKMSCVHYYRNGALLAVPLVSQITDAVVDDRVDSQRRRLGRDR